MELLCLLLSDRKPMDTRWASFQSDEAFSRKAQLLPAPVELLPWPLLCVGSRADFVRSCSHAEGVEQEELSGTAGLCLLPLWP